VDPSSQPTLPSSGRPLPGTLPERIGGYAIKRKIASGGMGTIYEGVQEQPRRPVAIKVMRRGVVSPEALRRFQYESQILARLRHPGIAQVYEAGTYADGDETLPFFAMEYISNAKSLTDYARDKNVGVPERLELFARVCDAVHYGHQKGIIHRDLKPSNILVDSLGHPRIIDFGVARATDSDLALATLQTEVGQLIGSLQYMSPEQFDADPHDIDTRSDVYALGIILYELLCGKLPYDLGGTAIHDAARVVREQQPPRPEGGSSLRSDAGTIVF
jgi:non-specific serine/threonine protein kinase/serine/threonine-protein kinase